MRPTLSIASTATVDAVPAAIDFGDPIHEVIIWLVETRRRTRPQIASAIKRAYRKAKRPLPLHVELAMKTTTPNGSRPRLAPERLRWAADPNDPAFDAMESLICRWQPAGFVPVDIMEACLMAVLASDRQHRNWHSVRSHPALTSRVIDWYALVCEGSPTRARAHTTSFGPRFTGHPLTGPGPLRMVHRWIQDDLRSFDWLKGRGSYGAYGVLWLSVLAHPNCPTDVLVVPRGGTDAWRRHADFLLARHPNTAPSVLADLAEHPTPKVRAAALADREPLTIRRNRGHVYVDAGYGNDYYICGLRRHNENPRRRKRCVACDERVRGWGLGL